jgi:hypothetical protein
MLFFVDSRPHTTRLRYRKERKVKVQLLLSFLSAPVLPKGAAPVWDALDDEQRAAVVATLARLIAKAAMAGSQLGVAADQGRNDE